MNEVLDEVYDEMFKASLYRSAPRTRTVFRFVLRVSELKARLNLVRLRKETLDQVLAYFATYAAEATHNPDIDTIQVCIDLRTAALNVAQAKLLVEHWK